MKAPTETGFQMAAFANRSDAFHDVALSVADNLTEPLLTCEAVLAETNLRLSDAGLVIAMIDEGLMSLEFDAADHRTHLKSLAKKYKDRPPDFTDFCLVRMSELFSIYPVVTVDSDFRVYCKNKRGI